MTVPEAKTCERCGREITWRKKWARDWDNVRYCSAACRKARLSATDLALEQAIIDILSQRGSKTMCPGEAARRIGGVDWKDLNEPAKQAARRLVAAGKIRMLQKNREVDPSRARGPVRLQRIESAHHK